MGVEIVTNKHDLFSVRVYLIKKPLDAVCPVSPRPLPQSLRMTPSCKRLREEEDAACPVSHVLIILVTYTGATGCKALSRFRQKLDRLLVHAYNRTPFIVWEAIYFQHNLHCRDKRRTPRGRYALALLQMRLISFF